MSVGNEVCDLPPVFRRAPVLKASQLLGDDFSGAKVRTLDEWGLGEVCCGGMERGAGLITLSKNEHTKDFYEFY